MNNRNSRRFCGGAPFKELDEGKPEGCGFRQKDRYLLDQVPEVGEALQRTRVLVYTSNNAHILLWSS